MLSGLVSGRARLRVKRRHSKTGKRFSSTHSLTCVIQGLNAEQDHDFNGGGSRNAGGSNGVRRAIMHPCQRAEPGGLSTALLCQHDVLHHVIQEYSSVLPTALKESFVAGDKCNMRADRRRRVAAPIMGGLASGPSRHRVGRVVASATFVALHVSNLIQGH